MAPSPDPTAMLHPCEPAPRIPPRPIEELSDAARATLERIPGAGLKGEGFPRQVLGQLLHSPALLDGFLAWWVAGKTGLALSGREQELVILCMGRLYESDYVWRHHVKVGREFGISVAELQWLRSGALEHFPARDQALLVLTEALVNERTIPPAVWAVHGCQLNPRELVDLIALVSQYVLFALTNNALQVPLEPALESVPGLATGTGSGGG